MEHINNFKNAASEKQVELSKKQEKERKKAALEKQIPLDETEIKELTSQIGAAENEIIRLQTEYVNEEKGCKRDESPRYHGGYVSCL